MNQPKPAAPKRLPQWVVTVGAVLVVLLTAALFLAPLEDVGYARFVDVADSLSDVHQDTKTFVVQAAPYAQIELLVNGNQVATASVPKSGQVQFTQVPVATGANDIVARVTVWYAAGAVHVAREEFTNPPQGTKDFHLDYVQPNSGGETELRGSGPQRTDLVIWESSRKLDDPKAGWSPIEIIDRVHTGTNDSATRLATFRAHLALSDGLHRFWLAPSNCVDQSCFIAAKQEARVQHSSPPPGEVRNGRSLALRIQYQRLDAAAAIRLSRDDPSVDAIVHGRIDLPTFISNVFDNPVIVEDAQSLQDPNSNAGTSIAELFVNAVPQYYISQDDVTVSVESGFRALEPGALPATFGSITIANKPAEGASLGVLDRPQGVRLWSRDTLRVTAEDYRVIDPRPVPFQTRGDTYTWERPFTDPAQPVRLAVAYAPLASPAATRRGLTFAASSMAPHFAPYLMLLHGLVLGIPMLVYLYLCDARKAPRFRKIARRLLALAVAADVFEACLASQPQVDSFLLQHNISFKSVAASTLTDLVLPALNGALLGLIAWAVLALAKRFKGTVAWVVLEAARAMRTAAFGYAMFAPLAFFLSPFVHAPLAYPVLVDLIFFTLLLFLLNRLDWRMIVWSKKLRLPFWIATVIVALVIAMPFSLVHYGMWAASPAQAAVTFNSPGAPLVLATTFLRGFSAVCPFAFGLLLIARSRPDVTAVGLTRENFARLAFCCYAVESTGTVLFIPVSFILAWLTFDWIRRDAPREATSIRDARPHLIREILARTDMSHLATKVASLTDECIDGTITQAQFRERRSKAIQLIVEGDDPRSHELLAVAPYPDARRNGMAPLALALLFAATEIVVFLSGERAHLSEFQTTFTALDVVTFAAVIVGSFVVPAFAFGASYEWIAGDSGTRKALTLAVWVILCSLPSWLLRLDGAAAILALIVATAAFYTALGFYFDVLIVRLAMRNTFSFGYMARLAGLPAVSWVGGVTVAAFSVAINAFLTGQFQSGLSQIAGSFVRQTLSQPP